MSASEFIADYNNPMQPLSIELQVGGRYKTSNGNMVVTINQISTTNSTITYETKYASLTRSAHTATAATANIDTFFKMLESGLTHVRTFITTQPDIGNGVFVFMMTSQPTSNDGLAAAKSAVAQRQQQRAELRKKMPSTVAATEYVTSADADHDNGKGNVVERTPDTLYSDMEVARTTNIAYSKGVNIAVTLTIPRASGDTRKYKFQILECEQADSMNGKYHYNVWASEHAFCKELATEFTNIAATNSSGKYYHEDAKVGRHRWFQITRTDFDKLISAKNGIEWEITQFTQSHENEGGEGGEAASQNIKLTNGIWTVDAISKPMFGFGGFKEGDQLREEGGNKSITNDDTVIHRGSYKVSPIASIPPTVVSDDALTTEFDFYIEKDYEPMDGTWRCITCYLVTIRPKPPSADEANTPAERTQFPVHLKNFFSLNLKPTDKIDADKISAALSKSGKKVTPKRRWWLTNTGGLQFILPASEYRTWAKAYSETDEKTEWDWKLPADPADPNVAAPVIPGKWTNINPSMAVSIIKDNNIAAAAATTGKESRNIDVHGTCNFIYPRADSNGDDKDMCTFIMHAPEPKSSFATVLVKFVEKIKPDIIQTDAYQPIQNNPNNDKMILKSLLGININRKFTLFGKPWSMFDAPYQYSDPVENVCLGDAISMAFSISVDDYKKMRDDLLANPKDKFLHWELITYSSWKMDDAASSGVYDDDVLFTGIGCGSSSRSSIGSDTVIIGKPGGMAFDLEGNLLVADYAPGTSCIHIVNRKNGKFLGRVGNDDTTSEVCSIAVAKPDCCFKSPRDVKFNPNDGVNGQLVVCDTGNDRVVIMDYATGDTVLIINGANPPDSDPGAKFTKPVSISISRMFDTNTNLKVNPKPVLAIYCNTDQQQQQTTGCIKLFNFETGHYAGTVPDTTQNPTNPLLLLGNYTTDDVFTGTVAFDVDNNLIITDPTNERIIFLPIINVSDDDFNFGHSITQDTPLNGLFILGSRMIASIVNSTPADNALLAFEYIIENATQEEGTKTKTITVRPAPEYPDHGVIAKLPDKNITDVTAYVDGAIFVSNTTDNCIKVYVDKKAELAMSLKPLVRTADYSEAGKAAYDVKIADVTKKLDAVDDPGNNTDRTNQLKKELEAATSGKAFYESREHGLATANAVKDANARVDDAKKKVTWKLDMFMNEAGKQAKKAAIAEVEDLAEIAKHDKDVASQANSVAEHADTNARQNALNALNEVPDSPKGLGLKKGLELANRNTHALVDPQKAIHP